MTTATAEQFLRVDSSNNTLDISRRSCRNQAMRKYYESKVEYLQSRNIQPNMIRLACNDVPFEVDSLSSPWKRDRFIRKCMRYYRGKIRELERENSKKFFFGIF